MADTSESQRRRNKKKNNSAANSNIAEKLFKEIPAENDSGSLPVWLKVVAGGNRSRISAAILLPAASLKRANLERGDPVLVETGSGCQTVAVCDAGGSADGVVLSRGVEASLVTKEGDLVSITADFSAEEATAIEVEIPSKLDQAWQEFAGALKLDEYVKAVLDGALIFSGDLRVITVGGKSWDLRIRSCTGADGNHSRSDAEGVAASKTLPRLVTKTSNLRVFVAESHTVNRSPATGRDDSVIGFARVGGLRSVIEELKEAVQLPLEKPDLYRRLGVGPPKGVLLFGPPGTGKTLLARSLSEELGCPVELVAATDLVGQGIGGTEERISGVFAKCRELARRRGTGALLFIDEIDAVCPKRDDATEAERRMVAAFLTAVDGVSGDASVVVLGATNRPDSIDPAMRRAGRLEREIEVGVPNTEERAAILDVHLSALRHDLTDEQKQELARRCHGYVGADLRAVCMAAARSCLRAGREYISIDSCLAALRVVPPSALKELLVEVPRVRWGDIGGYETTKEALREAVEWPIRHAWAFSSMNVEPPRGVLLYGPPGCSKTMMAKAVATETEMNFISIKGPELFSKYVGDSERAVRDVFRKARTAAPCVVFFDEIDAIGSNREGEGSGSVSSRVLAQLLAEMDGVGATSTRRHVFVLAATNRPHMLDPALTRPGRFDRLVHVPLPDQEAREAVFRGCLSRMKVVAQPDFPDLARRTQGCSGAELVMACREAALKAIRESVEYAEPGIKLEPSIKHEHLENAVAQVRPRISTETAQFYVDFEKKMRLSG